MEDRGQDMAEWYESRQVLEDMEEVLSAEYLHLEGFRGRTIAVTGATGLLGKLTMLALLKANERWNLDLRLIGIIRNEKKAQELFAPWCTGAEDSPLSFRVMDINCPIEMEDAVDYLVHTASVTASKEMVDHPYDTVLTSILGTKNMLDYCIKNKSRIKKMVYLSSMEFYGAITDGSTEVREDSYGLFDPLVTRSSYPEGKRASECLCAMAAKQEGVPVCTIRLGQTFGAGIAKQENRAFAQFARSGMAGADIVLHTKGEKSHCYCYTSDAVGAILFLLQQGEAGEAYNAANAQTYCSIKELAQCFASEAGMGSRVVVDIPENLAALGYAPDTCMRLSTEKLEGLGWKARVGLSEMARRLLEDMRS